ncbi:MAG: DUF2220 domain-containing protein [Ruminococcus sp.]|nr:DUF2220 domain-containing protein [Ruminococcus sp.]
MTKIKDKIYSFSGKYITLDELKNIIRTEDYKELVGKISELEKCNVIRYVKNSSKNGMTPPLYMKYRIISEKKDYSDVIAEIKLLHHYINAEKFIRFPEKYEKVRNLIFNLSEYLKNNPNSLESPMSENEKAYLIWHDEKILDKPENIRILKETGVFDKLNVYSTPEPFFDYRIKSVPENVLVTENKDTWFTLRKIMLESHSGISLYGKFFDCVLYGEGRKVTKSESSLADYLSLDNFSGQVYYWGDIDYEGIGIFLSAEKVNSKLSIKPFISAYSDMIQEFEKIYSVKYRNSFLCRKAQRIPENIDIFLSFFDSVISRKIEKYLAEGLYIPQEIINYNILKNSLERCSQ